MLPNLSALPTGGTADALFAMLGTEKSNALRQFRAALLKKSTDGDSIKIRIQEAYMSLKLVFKDLPPWEEIKEDVNAKIRARQTAKPKPTDSIPSELEWIMDAEERAAAPTHAKSKEGSKKKSGVVKFIVELLVDVLGKTYL